MDWLGNEKARQISPKWGWHGTQSVPEQGTFQQWFARSSTLHSGAFGPILTQVFDAWLGPSAGPQDMGYTGELGGLL